MPAKNIEMLQKDVDQIAKELSDLKKETDEAAKRSKAESATEKVKNVQEAIKQKLKALEGLSDAKSLAEASRLNAMLKTLESSDSELDALKTAVVGPIEAPKAKATIDNTADFTSITDGITALTSLVAELQTIIDEYIRQKSTLNDQQKIAKEQEIEQKKTAVEAKRKEVQDIIDKVRKGRKEFKIDDVQDADLKKAIIDQKAKEEVSLIAYETQLKAIKTPASSVREKVKNGASDLWEKVKTGAEKAWERGKENPGKAIAVTAGIGLLVWGISKLFGKKKEKAEGKEKKEKKPRWKKALMRLGIGTGGLLIRKNRDKIKGRLGLGEKPNENIPHGDFENLSEEMKNKYRTLSADIDASSTGEIPVFDTESQDKDKDRKSEIIFELDKKIGDMANFNTTATLDYIQGETNDGIFDRIQNRGKGLLYDALGGFLSKLESFKPFGAGFVSDPANAIAERLKGGKPEERKKLLSSFYREYMNILDYLTDKKKIILYKKAKESIMGIDNMEKEPDEDQKKRIEDLYEDKDRCNKQLKGITIADIPGLMLKYKIDKTEVSEETKKIKEKLDEEKDEILQTGDDRFTILDRAGDDFQDGKLEKDTRDDLIEMYEDRGDDLFGNANKMGFFGAYTHLLTDMFGGNKELADSYMKQMGYDELIDEIKIMITGDISKLKSDSFTKDDLVKVQSKIQEYFAAKENFTKHMEDIKGSNDSRFERPKLFNSLFVEPFKDVGKAFGLGKTDSRWERIGRGLGGATVSGGVLYITGSVIGVARPGIGALVRIGGKTAFKIGTLPVELLKIGITKSLGRTYLTGLGRSETILKSNFSKQEIERLVSYAFLKGEISQEKALILLEKGTKTTYNVDGLLGICGIKDAKNIELFKKYGDNKNIRKLFFEFDNNFEYNSRWSNIKHNFVDRILKKNVMIRPDAFARIGEIDDFLGRCTHAGKSALVRGFLETTKELKPEMIQELFATQTFDAVSPEMSKDIGRLLGRKMSRFASVDDFKAFQAFFTRNFTRYPSETFVANALSNRGKLKTLNEAEQARYIETAKLNTSFLERRINAMKENFRKSAETLRNLIKNKRTPYPASVESVANGLDEIAQVDNETLAAMQAAPEVGEGSWLLKMSKDRQLMQEILPLFKNKEFVNEIAKAKDSGSIKAVFEKFGKKLPNDIPDEFVNSLANTKSTKKIADTMKYVEKYEEMTKIQKIFKAPGMKYAGRVFGRALSIVGFATGAYSALGKFNEAAEIAKTNEDRAAIKRGDAWFESGYAVAAGVEAAGAFGALAGVESACAFVPGIGRVVGGVILGASYFLKEAVFETLDKYNKNYKDLLGQAPLQIREHIMSTVLGGAKEDRSFGDRTVGIFKNMEHLSKKTGSEGIKALLYTEERKYNQLAMININDQDLMDKLAKESPPITRVQVAEAIEQVERNVQTRYEYLKKRCGTYTEEGKEYVDLQKVVSADAIRNGTGLRALDKMLLESQYCVSDPDAYGDPQKIEQQQKKAKEELDKEKGKFTALAGLFEKDPVSMIYMYRYINDYRQHLQQFGFDESGGSIEPAYETIVKNMDYFDAFMGYEIIGQGLDVNMYSSLFHAPDFVILRDFFASYKLENPISDKELFGSASKLQTILYRIATEVVGAKISNTMEDIKNVFNESNEKAYGIYFHDDKLDINGNYFADTEYMGNDIETVKKIRADIQEQAKDNDLIDIGTGDAYFNKEFGARYLKIIDQEIARA